MKLLLEGPLLVIGAHPDDVELMAGGVIGRATSQKADVYSMVISDGGQNGDIEVRHKELKKASKILGIKEVKTCGLKDGEVPHNLETVKMVEKYIKDVNPSVIITHTDEDTHQDHKNVCHISLSAARFQPTIVLLGETPSSYFHDNLVYFNITDSIDRKVKALSMYNSQIRNGPVSIENIKTLAAFRGNRVQVKYAEAFVSWRMLL
ncbi:MAG: PIG-L deacetylase family protein [Candidatus Doudnabacteria bacterium]